MSKVNLSRFTCLLNIRGSIFWALACHFHLTWCHWWHCSALEQCPLSWLKEYSGQFLLLCLPSSPHCPAVLLLVAPSPWEQRGTDPHRDRVSQREWWKLELQDVLTHKHRYQMLHCHIYMSILTPSFVFYSPKRSFWGTHFISFTFSGTLPVICPLYLHMTYRKVRVSHVTVERWDINTTITESFLKLRSWWLLEEAWNARVFILSIPSVESVWKPR